MAANKSKNKSKRSAAAKPAEKLKREAKVHLQKAKKKFLQLEKKVESFARKNPEKALLIASAVGAAIGTGLTALIKGKKKK